MLALALLAGLRGASYGRRALFVLPAAWLLGGLIGLAATSASAHPVASAFWFLLLGGLLAADAKLSLQVITGLAALLGLYHGYLNGTGLSLGHICRGYPWPHLCGFCSGRVGRRSGCAIARFVGAHHGARGGKLDCRQRPANAGLGSAAGLTRSNGTANNLGRVVECRYPSVVSCCAGVSQSAAKFRPNHR